MPATRNYHSPNLIVSFARHGVALDTISRALVVALSYVKDVVRKAVDTGELMRSPPETASNPKSAMFVELAALRELVDQQTATIRELRNAGNDPIDELMLQLTGWCGLTRNEAKLLAVLMHHGRLTKDRLYFAMYGNSHSQPLAKIIDTLICRIREKIGADIHIETLWAVGYEMKPDAVARLKEAAGISERAPSPSIVPAISEMAA